MTEDDASIKDSTDLFRRVHPTQVVWDGNKERLRPTSAAFTDEEMSVNLSDDMEREGVVTAALLAEYPEHHLVSLTAEYVRSEEQVVVRSHLPDDASHGDVVGTKGEGRRKRFSYEAKWDILNRESLKEAHRARFDSEQAA